MIEVTCFYQVLVDYVGVVCASDGAHRSAAIAVTTSTSTEVDRCLHTLVIKLTHTLHTYIIHSFVFYDNTLIF